MGVDLVQRRRHYVDVLDKRTGVRRAPEQFDLFLACGVYLDHVTIDLLPACISKPIVDLTRIAGYSEPDLRWKACDVTQRINRTICHQATTAHDEHAVGSLPENEGETVWLKLAGHTHKEIGEMLDVHKDTIDRYWNKACIKLAKPLGPFLTGV